MKHTHLLTLALLTSSLLILPACSKSKESSSDKKATTSEKATSHIDVTLTGAVEMAYKGEMTSHSSANMTILRVMCSKTDMRGQNELNLMLNKKGKPFFSLTIPMQTLKIGTLALYGSEDKKSNEAGNVLLGFKDRNKTYDSKHAEGSVTLTQIPTKRGERAVGTVKAKILNKENENINLEVNFDVEASDYTFMECKYGQAYTK